MSKFSEEMETWIKQQEIRKEHSKSCIESEKQVVTIIDLQIKNLTQRKEIILKAIQLEEKQIELIQEETDKAIEQWENS